jgi:hypothetical protein
MPTCRPGSSVLDGLQPGRQAQHGESGHIHIAASSVKPLRGARHQRFGTGTTSDRTPGPRAGTSPTVPSQTHTTASVPCTTQTVHRGTVNVGTWNVRGLNAEARSQTCGRELDSPKTSLSALSKRPGWTRNRHRHDSRVQLCRTAGYATEVGPWRNRVPDQTRCHGLRYAAALERASLIKPHGSD